MHLAFLKPGTDSPPPSLDCGQCSTDSAQLYRQNIAHFFQTDPLPLIASIVPTARFAQPIGAVILYPMIALCGLFVPLEALQPKLQAFARVLPLTYAVSLLQGIWKGEAWSAHFGDIVGLVVVFAVCTALSAKVFRWE